VTLLRNSGDFVVLVDRVASQLGYPPAFVERDYWITEILRAISRPIDACGAAIIFKGGTSLSKGWKLLQRMSEDVDVIVAFDPPIGRSAIDRTLKAIVERVEHDIGIIATGTTGERGVHRAREFKYIPLFTHDALTGQRVLLELGTRGGSEPHRLLTVRSLVAETAVSEFAISNDEFEEFATFEVRTLSPERTLLEKLAAIHNIASEAMADPAAFAHLRTKLRHVYDIAMLLQSETTVSALKQLDLPALLADIEQRSIENGWPWTARPAAGYAASPAFDPSFFEHPAVSEAYARVTSLVIGGSAPSYVEVVDIVRSNERLL